MDNLKKDFEGYLSNIELEKRLKYYEKHYGPYIEKRGMQNWKNLFRKPTMLEWTILFMLLMGLYIGWAYVTDTNNLKAQCCLVCEQQGGIVKPITNQNYLHLKEVNLTNLTIGEIGDK
jgi:hypothetical protein